MRYDENNLKKREGYAMIDYLVLGIIAALALLAWHGVRRQRKRGGCAGYSGCAGRSGMCPSQSGKGRPS